MTKITDFEQKRKEKKQKTKQNTVPLSEDEAITVGIDQGKKNLDNAQGFLLITFDENQDPDILWAGAMEPYTTLGVMKYTMDAFSAATLHNPFLGERPEGLEFVEDVGFEFEPDLFYDYGIDRNDNDDDHEK